MVLDYVAVLPGSDDAVFCGCVHCYLVTIVLYSVVALSGNDDTIFCGCVTW